MRNFSLDFNNRLTFDLKLRKKYLLRARYYDLKMKILTLESLRPIYGHRKAILFVAFYTVFASGKSFSSPGECGLDFLNIPVGAYSVSTGQANFAGIDGPEALFGNPSLYGNRLEGFASYQYLLMDTRSEAVALSVPIADRYTLGLGINHFDPGDITGYSADGQMTGSVRSGDYHLRAGISIERGLLYGLSVTYYRQQLDNITGQGYGFGFGVTYNADFGRVSLTAENLGPDFKIGTSSVPLPAAVALSGWFPVRSRYLNINGDLIMSREKGFKAAVGLEYSPVSRLFLRAGSNNDYPISMGLGFANDNLRFDYSYIPEGIFGERHIFSVTLSR